MLFDNEWLHDVRVQLGLEKPYLSEILFGAVIGLIKLVGWIGGMVVALHFIIKYW